MKIGSQMTAKNGNTRIAGVLGGMGPGATVDFMSRVISLTPADADQDHVRMLVNHNPTVPDRQIDSDQNKRAVEESLSDMALVLEKAGADFLVMPCNTAHGFIGRAVAAVSIPFVHIVTATVNAIGRTEPEATRIGLLATDACLNAGLYQSAGHDAGMALLLPSKSEQASIMQLVFRIKGGDQGSEVAHEMFNRANSLIQRGADVVIAGCTEIPLVISAERLTVPFLSSTDILAEQTVALCLGHTSLQGQ